jgi:hypothetical protein
MPFLRQLVGSIQHRIASEGRFDIKPAVADVFVVIPALRRPKLLRALRSRHGLAIFACWIVPQNLCRQLRATFGYRFASSGVAAAR